MSNQDYKARLREKYPNVRIEYYELAGKSHFQVFTPTMILGYGNNHVNAWKAAYLKDQRTNVPISETTLSANRASFRADIPRRSYRRARAHGAESKS